MPGHTAGTNKVNSNAITRNLTAQLAKHFMSCRACKPFQQRALMQNQ